VNTPDRQWWIAQSGEYVLGTLDYADWVTFRKTIEHDNDARQLVLEWERWFQPLADSLTPLQPADHVWIAINKKIAAQSLPGATVTRLHERDSVAATLEKKVDRWRGFAGLATAASLLLASLAWVNHLSVRDLQAPDSAISVAKFSGISIIRDTEAAPLWVVDAAFDDGFVRVTAVAPPPIDASNAYELWIVKPDDGGVQSMGLIPSDIDESFLLKVSEVSETPIAFAVSLEPAGGSALDTPSGPVLYQGVFQNLKL